MPAYESFNAAERALDNFAGWDTARGIRPMTPHERQQAQQLLKDRRTQITEHGKKGIATMRKGVRERGAALVRQYDAAEQLLDELEDGIDDGVVSVDDIERALADAARLDRTLRAEVDSHYAVAEQASQEIDPEKFMCDLYRKYPALRSGGRVNPWDFPW